MELALSEIQIFLKYGRILINIFFHFSQQTADH